MTENARAAAAPASQIAWIAGPVDETIRPEDEAAIRACVLDYFEGWFDADPVRMDRALHPLLSKLCLDQDADRSGAIVTTKAAMVEATREGRGRTRDVPDRAIVIEVAGVSGDIAASIVHSAVYTEYVLLVRTDDGWRITSTVWHWAPGNGPRR
jgi:putative lumazine-binding protein